MRVYAVASDKIVESNNRISAHYSKSKEQMNIFFKKLGGSTTKLPLVAAIHSKISNFKSRDLAPVFPEHVHVETSSICNAKCIMCGYSVMKRPKGIMSAKLFDTVRSQLRDNGVKQVTLQFYGEPLLDKKIFSRIVALKKSKMLVSINTNASLLDQDNGRKLIEAGLDRLNISFDGYSRETYNKIRINLDYDKVKNNIREFIALKKKLGTGPKTKITFVCLKENVAEIKPFIKYWQNKVNHVDISFASNWAGQIQVNGWEAVNRDVSRNPCKSLWKELIITQSGKVVICCNDFDAKDPMGDLNKESVAAIWNSEKYKNYRRLHHEGQREQIGLCKKCKKYSYWGF